MMHLEANLIKLVDYKITEGYLLGSIYKDHGRIELLQIDDTHRMQGHGKKLVSQFEGECDLHGVRRIEVYARANSDAYWEKLQYELDHIIAPNVIKRIKDKR